MSGGTGIRTRDTTIFRQRVRVLGVPSGPSDPEYRRADAPAGRNMAFAEYRSFLTVRSLSRHCQSATIYALPICLPWAATSLRSIFNC
jgi:hypothetical protein